MKSSFSFISLLIVLIACKKETPPETIDNSWKLFDAIEYQAKNASYCYSNGELMFIRSLTSFSLVDGSHNFLAQYWLNTSTSYLYKTFPMNSDYFITTDQGLNPIRIQYRSISDLTDVGNFNLLSDSSITGLEHIFGSLWDPVYLSSPSGKFVFKVKDSSNQNNSTLLITDISSPNVFKKKHLNSLPNYTSLHFYFNEKFYFSTTGINNELYALDTLGNYEKVGDRGFVTASEVNGTFYGLGISSDLFISLDLGQSWRKATVKAPSGQILGIQGKTFCLINDEVREVQITDNASKIVKYNSKGLEGNSLTWICYHNGRYYCTTKSGVYYLDEKYFAPE